MDFPNRAPPQGLPRRSPRATTRPGGAAMEADENQDPKRPVPAANASPLRPKVLGERNDRGRDMEATTPLPQAKPVPSPTTLTGRGAGAYDPKTNYTTPRPEFLRYDPERRREMLLRLAREAEFEEDDCSSAASGTEASEAAGSSSSVSPGSYSDAELEDGDEKEEEEDIRAGRGRWARRLFLLLVAVAFSCCYIFSANPAAFPVHSDDGLAFTGPAGGIDDSSVHEHEQWSSLSLRLSGLGPLYMMGPEDVLEETASTIVQAGSEHAHQYDHRVSSRNQMAMATMGLADMCPNVQLEESVCRVGDENIENLDDQSVCRVGDENIENLDDLKENSGPSEQIAAVVITSFESDACNISCQSIGSASTQAVDMEGGNSESVHQEEGEDYSNQLVPQLASAEKAIREARDKLDSRMGLKNEGLDIEQYELWQYEQTAEAAKEMCSKVKFMWSAMEPHLLQILTCLSLAGLVAAMFKYRPRSGEIVVPALQQMSVKSLAEVPVLLPHQIVQLPASPSPLVVQPPVPKQDLSRNLKVPMQLPLPETDASVSLKVPMVDHGNRPQKLQKGDAETLKALHGNSQYHRDNDSSKPPVVELLGEFTFGDSSSGKSVRNLNQHAGHVSVEESLKKSWGEDVDKKPKNSSILQTPIVGRARKEEGALKGEKDTTLTALRRSSRVRSKVTSR